MKEKKESESKKREEPPKKKEPKKKKFKAAFKEVGVPLVGCPHGNIKKEQEKQKNDF